MDIQITTVKGVQLIQPIGRLDGDSAPSLGDAMRDALESGNTQLVLALDSVDYISSAGLRQIVNAYKRAQKQGGDLRLSSPTERVMAVLELAGLDRTLSIFPTDMDAIDSY
ncbi:MAG: STAS domain-containing protein [Chloroflexi bacterium]|nr:STAS domain-containing protein [Chloroflexota bacterium]